MNVYDFDKTIYRGDSATHFWWFSAGRHPSVFLSVFGAAGPAAKVLTGNLSRGELKHKLYTFLQRIDDPRREVEIFWDRHIGGIFPWYLERRRDDDLIISASPDFLIEEACRRLGIHCMATPMEITTGRLLGENCRGAEKVRRFREVYPAAVIEEFFSDSLADLPMMEEAERGYLVRNGAVLRLVASRETAAANT